MSSSAVEATRIATCQSVAPCGGTQGVTDCNDTEVPLGPWVGLTEKVGSEAARARAIGRRSTTSKQMAETMKMICLADGVDEYPTVRTLLPKHPGVSQWCLHGGAPSRR